MKDHQQILNTLHYNTTVQSSALGYDPVRTLVRAGSEGYEKCAAAYRGDEYYVNASWEKLEKRAITNTTLFPLSIDNDDVPALPDTEDIAWVPAWSLTHEETCWIPAAYCYFGFPSGQHYARTNTRGLAAGPTLEFCTLKGLAELIESLAARRWQSRNTEVAEVDLASFEVPLFDAILRYHTDKKRTLWILDLSDYTEGGLSTFAALSHDPEQDTLLHGTATSHTPEHAIRSALLECTQMLPNLLLPHEEQQQSRAVHFGLEPYHKPGAEKRTAAYYAGKEVSDLTLREVVGRLNENDIEVLVKDLTRAEVPIRVARTMISIT